MMYSEPDLVLAQRIAEGLRGKFWNVTPGDWWVVVEGMTRQRLVVLTNDPLGVCFSPSELTMGLQTLRDKVFQELMRLGIVNEDGSWAAPQSLSA